MQTTKSIFQSQTLWGIVLTAISYFVHLYLSPSVTVPDNPDFTQLQQIAVQLKASNGNVMQTLNTIFGSLGLVLAIWGRIKADSKVTLSNPFKPISKPLTIIIGFMLIAGIVSAQSPFKPLSKPNKARLSFSLSDSNVVTKTEIKAWRFTPMTGYNLKTKQVQGGIGYGIQWLHFVDSTQKYYTDFSIKAVGWVNGSTTPSLNPPNLTSFGVTFGVLNELVQFGAAWTPKTPNTKGSVGPVIDFAIPLNN